MACQCLAQSRRVDPACCGEIQTATGQVDAGDGTGFSGLHQTHNFRWQASCRNCLTSGGFPGIKSQLQQPAAIGVCRWQRKLPQQAQRMQITSQRQTAQGDILPSQAWIEDTNGVAGGFLRQRMVTFYQRCLLYTSDAAD